MKQRNVSRTEQKESQSKGREHRGQTLTARWRPEALGDTELGAELGGNPGALGNDPCSLPPVRLCESQTGGHALVMAFCRFL